MSVLLLLSIACIEGEIVTNTTDTVPADVDLYADCAATVSVDDDLDGEREQTHTHAYDGWGNLIRYTTDDGADGVTNLVYDYTVTPSGEALITDKDDDGDGRFDQRWTYHRDADGWLESVDYDDGIDQVLDGTTTVTTVWDDGGLPLSTRAEKDDGPDGVVDEVETRIYAYDSGGYWMTVEGDKQADGEVDTHFEVRFDLDDRKLEARYDYGVDGTDDRFLVYHYTDDGQVNLIAVTGTDAGGNDAAVNVFHEFGDDGRLSEINRDDAADGSMDGATTFEWDCD